MRPPSAVDWPRGTRGRAGSTSMKPIEGGRRPAASAVGPAPRHLRGRALSCGACAWRDADEQQGNSPAAIRDRRTRRRARHDLRPDSGRISRGHRDPWTKHRDCLPRPIAAQVSARVVLKSKKIIIQPHNISLQPMFSRRRPDFAATAAQIVVLTVDAENCHFLRITGLGPIPLRITSKRSLKQGETLDGEEKRTSGTVLARRCRPVR